MRVRAHALRLLVAGLTTPVSVPMMQAPASAAVSCAYDPVADRVSVAFNSSATVLRGASGAPTSNDPIGVGSSTSTAALCPDPFNPSVVARVSNTDSIVVIGSSGTDTLDISLARGALGPGATAESSGISEIEFDVDLRGGSDLIQLSGGPGDDHVVFGAGTSVDAATRRAALNNDTDFDVALRAVENFSAAGNSGRDDLSALGGNATGSPLPLPVTLLGEDGADDLQGSSEDDTLNGGRHDDVLSGRDGDDHITTGPDTDTAVGGPGEDILENVDFGSGGNDVYIPGADDDVLVGSDSRETVSYQTAPGPVDVDVSAAQRATGEGTDTLISIEDVIGSSFADVIQGSDKPNTLNGAGGGDEIHGGQDHDLLIPGPGVDDLQGGAGVDAVAYPNAPSGIHLDLPVHSVSSAQGADSVRQIENAIGTPFQDVMFGDDEANFLVGGGGDDLFIGNAGDDRLLGGAGNDQFDGGEGTDVCQQDTGTGTLEGCENVGTFTVKPRTGVVAPGERLTYSVTWTHPQQWQRLNTVEIRFRDGDRVLAWVRWNQKGNTFQLFYPRSGDFGPRAEGASAEVLESPFALLRLRGSDQQVLNPKTILVSFNLSFRPAASGDLAVDVTAEDDRNNRMAWERAGTLKVARA